MDDALVIGACRFGAQLVVTVGLVDEDQVAALHDAFLDPLQLVACTGDLYQQEHIDHRAHGDFALSDADGFDEDDVETGRFADDHRFARLARDAAEDAAAAWLIRHGLVVLARQVRFRGGELDLEKAAAILLVDYRSGTLGRISLETPMLRAARASELQQPAAPQGEFLRGAVDGEKG